MARRGENIYKRKDGRYEGRYVIGRTPDGRTRFGYVYGTQYSAVRDELARKKAAQTDNRGDQFERRITLGEWMSGWIQGELRGNVRTSSFQTYLSLYEHHLADTLGCWEINRITPDAIRDFLESLYEKQLAVNTIKSIYRLLNTSLKNAQEEEIIRRNPCSKIRIRGSGQTEQRVLTAHESAALCSAAAEERELTVLLSLFTGMRLGEICALKWEDIDWQQQTLSVRRTVQRVAAQAGSDQKTALMIGEPKSNQSRRILPLPDFLTTMLKTARTANGSGYVFGPCGRAADPRTIQRRLERLADSAGLEGVHFHTLRHTFATRLMEAGVDVKTVSSLLGHSSARITLDFYAHSLLDQQRSAIEKLIFPGE